jgi:AraC-like DNA-binding protein
MEKVAGEVVAQPDTIMAVTRIETKARNRMSGSVNDVPAPGLGSSCLEETATRAPLVASTQGLDRLNVRAGGFHYRVTDYDSGLTLAAHRHENAKVSMALRGVYQESHGRHTFECTRGRLLLKPAGACHVDSYGATVTVLTIDVTPEVTASVHPVSRLFGRPAIMRMRAPLMNRVVAELNTGDGLAPLALEGLGLELLTLLARTEREPQPGPDAFSRACEYIDAHLGEPLRLDSIAAAAGIPSSHVTRLFRTHSSAPLRTWIRERRIAVARERLKDSSTSIVDLAADLGFYDQSHFTNVFRAVTGMTPGAWRSAS